ncbi:MAG: branched-chain amino acid ABC transporter substrate-binding protein [Magnetococcales bacterium]|nr:branched-chain amino acid ABC transporter substrate-binding protein [Magnetococcales bacterium]
MVHFFRSSVQKALFSVAIVALLALSGVSPLLAGEVVKIGVAGPFSGAVAAFGDQFWRGAEQAAMDLNAKGGIDGKKVVLVRGDDACEPKQALQVANRLVDFEEVNAIMGHFCSATTITASEIYADAGLLMMTPASTNPMVTERGLPTIFRNTGRDDQQGVVAANFVVEKLGAKQIAVIHDKSTYGQGIADAFKAHLHTLGLTEILYDGLTRGEKDFNALVTKIKGHRADAVYFGGIHSEAGPLARQLKEQGVSAPLISGDGIVSDEFVMSAGGPSYAQGVYMTFGADPRKIPAGKEVIARYRAKGIEPEGYTLYSYATIQAIAAAMEGAGTTTDGEKMAEWLHTHPVQTIMGAKTWDAKGDLSVSDYVIYQWDDQGSYQEVE